MPTAAIIRVLDELDRSIIIEGFQKFDGSPDSLGVTLANYSKGYLIAQGARLNNDGFFNGMGDFAAFLVHRIKQKNNEFMLVPPSYADKETLIEKRWAHYLYEFQYQNEEKPVLLSVHNLINGESYSCEPAVFVETTKVIMKNWATVAPIRRMTHKAT